MNWRVTQTTFGMPAYWKELDPDAEAGNSMVGCEVFWFWFYSGSSVEGTPG